MKICLDKSIIQFGTMWIRNCGCLIVGQVEVEQRVQTVLSHTMACRERNTVLCISLL